MRTAFHCAAGTEASRTRYRRPWSLSSLIVLMLIAANPVHASAPDAAERASADAAPSRDATRAGALRLVDPLNPKYGQELAGRSGIMAGVAIEYLSLDDIYERFESNAAWNRHVASQIERAEAFGQGARAFEDPTLNYDVAGHVRGEDFVDGSQHAFYVEWEAPLRRVRHHRSEEIRAMIALAREQIAIEREDYLQRIREAWAGVEVEMLRVALLFEAIHRIEEIADVIQKRVDEGVAAPFDAARVAHRLAELRADYEQTLDHLVMYSMLTAQLIGVDNWLPLPRKLWSPPNYGERALLGSNEIDPEVRQARAEARLAQQGVERAKAERTPALVVSGGVQYATTPAGLAGLGGASVRLPLFGAGKASVREAAAEASAASARADWTENVSVAQREASLRNWQMHRDALERYDEFLVPQTVQLEELARQSYTSGGLGFAELFEAIDTRVRTSLARVGLVEELAEQDVLLRRWLDSDAPLNVEILNTPDDDSVSFENDGVR